jgi:alginate O-acetyltransferase complex protein AlgI
MLLGGLWHGASWNFVLWGGLHGAALCAHKWYVKHFPARPPRGKFAAALSAAAANIASNTFVCFCWIFFRADTFTTAREIITGIVTWQDGIIQLYAWAIIAIMFVIIGTLWVIWKQRRVERAAKQIDGFYPILNLSKFWHLVIFFIIIGCIAGLGYTGANPFIYFQF